MDVDAVEKSLEFASDFFAASGVLHLHQLLIGKPTGVLRPRDIANVVRPIAIYLPLVNLCLDLFDVVRALPARAGNYLLLLLVSVATLVRFDRYYREVEMVGVRRQE